MSKHGTLIKFHTLLLLFIAAPALALQNQLADHPSPYLAMHSDDPVHWQDWSRNTLQLAKQEGKLLFVSSGYFACHWCHVMRRESYNNEQIAALLNKHFIPVKLDRELEPALDAHLIDFVQRTQGRAGWPLNVFLTPEGYPLVGMTYMPAEDFHKILNNLHHTWSDEPDSLRDMARRGLLTLIKLRETAPPEKPVTSAELSQAYVQSALQMGDDLLGGFGQANRFPMSPQLDVLLQIYTLQPDEKLADFLKLTLDQMADNGLRDHLDGGFYRYTVDPTWYTPHYEKMLYTQALLSRIYMEAASILKQEQYLAVAEDTLDFVMRKMRSAQGGYVASFSAVDDRDVEGGYYLWRTKELEEILPPDLLKVAARYWHLESADHPNEAMLPLGGISTEKLAEELELKPEVVEQQIERARKLLLEARAKRGLPVDGKRLAGWNGLMVGAFATGSKVLERKDFLEAAEQLRDFLLNELWDGAALSRARQGGKPLGEASLEDYAYVAEGLARLSAVTGNKQDADLSNKLLTLAWQRFYSKDGWQSSEHPVLPGMPKSKAQDDGALPSPAALVISLSLKSGDGALINKARSAAADSLAAIQDQPFWYASHVAVLINSKKPVLPVDQ